MAKVTIDLDASPLRETLERIRAKTDNLSPLMSDFLGIAVHAVTQRFKRQGPGWKEHAPSTKARRGPNAPILRDTGRLEGSVTGQAGGYATAGRDYIEIGTNLKYAAIHNFGGEVIVKGRKTSDARGRKSTKADVRGRKKGKELAAKQTAAKVQIPARRFLPLEEELMPSLLEAAESYFGELS